MDATVTSVAPYNAGGSIVLCPSFGTVAWSLGRDVVIGMLAQRWWFRPSCTRGVACDPHLLEWLHRPRSGGRCGPGQAVQSLAS
jgi:hypothetical protein